MLYFLDSKMHYFLEKLHKSMLNLIVQMCVNMTCKGTEISMLTMGIMVVVTWQSETSFFVPYMLFINT